MWDDRRPSDELLGLIARAALDVSAWSDVGDAIIGDLRAPTRLYQSLRATKGGGYSYDVHDGGTTDPAVMATLADYEAIDVTGPAIAQGVMAQGPHRPSFLHDWLDDDVYRSSPFCQEFMRDVGGGETAAVLLSGTIATPTILTFMAPFGERLDAVMRDRLTTIAPYLRRAAGHYEATLSAGVAPTTMVDLLRAETGPALLLDREGRIMVANAAAEALLTSGPVLGRHKRLTCFDAGEQQALDAAVLGAVGSRHGALGDVEIGPPAGRIRVRVASVGGRIPFVDMSGPVGAVVHFLKLPSVWGGDHARPALTVRQRDCLTLLADGARPDEIAYRLGIARVTVDMHLREARLKLGARTLYAAVAIAVSRGEINPG